MSEQVKISGSVERITFYNADNGYTVLRLKPDARNMLPFKYAGGRQGLITVVGNLPEVNPGEWLKLTGRWSTHAKHGRQFDVDLCEQSVPATTEGMRRYLGSGLIRGVGPVMAERIVDQFGEQTLDVIELEPGRLHEVPGIGRKRVTSITRAWAEQQAIKNVMLFLQSNGVSTNLATKIYKKYGDDSLAVVQNRPYQLVQDIYGIGFRTADQIAQALGLARDDPGRIEAGVAYTLNRLAEAGHVYVPQEILVPEAEEILGVPAAAIAAVIDGLESGHVIRRDQIATPADVGAVGRVGAPENGGQPQNDDQPQNGGAPEGQIREARAVYLTPFYHSEVGLTRLVQQLLDHPTSRLAGVPVQRAGDRTNDRTLVQLTAQQAQGVQAALRHKVAILTGGPGTGKTTALRSLLDQLDAAGRTTLLAAPTGRAAKRMSEATGRPARTVHRLLGFQPGEGFGQNEANPLDADMIVIDEASMLDLMLAYNLFKAIAPDSHVLLVGDVDQLPSVGAGDVLRDLIAAGVTAVVQLDTIFRQAAGSLIIQNAHRINQGQSPVTRPDAEDFFLFVKEEPEEAAELLVDIVDRRIPQKFGLDPLDDIQVLSPMYNGALGVLRLNEMLQTRLNPPGRRKLERRINGRLFRRGDKLMQTVNNYDKNVFNGDIGRVTALDPIQQTLTLSVDGAPVVYDFLELDELTHAYAISVHKSQGAEYPCVVVPVVTQHYMMLQRNLLYTAVTRARRLVILVGTRKAINIAVKNNAVAGRYSALDVRLRAGRAGAPRQ